MTILNSRSAKLSKIFEGPKIYRVFQARRLESDVFPTRIRYEYIRWKKVCRLSFRSLLSKTMLVSQTRSRVGLWVLLFLNAFESFAFLRNVLESQLVRELLQKPKSWEASWMFLWQQICCLSLLFCPEHKTGHKRSQGRIRKTGCLLLQRNENCCVYWSLFLETRWRNFVEGDKWRKTLEKSVTRRRKHTASPNKRQFFLLLSCKIEVVRGFLPHRDKQLKQDPWRMWVSLCRVLVLLRQVLEYIWWHELDRRVRQNPTTNPTTIV